MWTAHKKLVIFYELDRKSIYFLTVADQNPHISTTTFQRNNILNHLTRDIKKQLERSVADIRFFPLKINMDAGFFLLFLTLTQLLLGQQIKN